jgi:hypothetical protein
MCTYPSWTRKKETMSNSDFEIILKKFIPYKQMLRYLTLHGCVEPLLDKGLPLKVRLAKNLQFRGTGFATNCTHLDKKFATELLTAGLDTIICSIDGVTRNTHEMIRVGTDYNRCVNNVLNFIKIRKEIGNTRVIIRFIRQNLNAHEWTAFKRYWDNIVEKRYGDAVIKFDVHNWGNKLNEYESKKISTTNQPDKNVICEDVFNRMMIYSNGEIGLCCADDNGYFRIGNLLKNDPIKLYNSKIFYFYREMMEKGKISQLEHCKNCNMPNCRLTKDRVE